MEPDSRWLLVANRKTGQCMLNSCSLMCGISVVQYEVIISAHAVSTSHSDYENSMENRAAVDNSRRENEQNSFTEVLYSSGTYCIGRRYEKC